MVETNDTLEVTECKVEELTDASAQRLLAEAQCTIAHLESANDKYIEHNKALQERLSKTTELLESTTRVSKKIINTQRTQLKSIKTLIQGIADLLDCNEELLESED